MGDSSDVGSTGLLRAYLLWREDPGRVQPWFEALEETTRILGEEVMGRLLEYLGSLGLETAVMIPTGYLALLPLHAARILEGCAELNVIDRLTATFAPSAHAVAYARSFAERASDGALLVVDEPQPITEGGPIPYSRMEVEGILPFFEPRAVQLLRHRQARREEILARLPAARVAHLSCHGFNDWLEPLDSGLLLADDEPLTVRDLLNLRLAGGRLAVLSACESGIIGTRLPDEVVALPTALLQAGFAGVVASLWSVNALSTALLMEQFYRLWLEGRESPGRALREAQVWLRTRTAGELAERLRAERARPDEARRLPRELLSSTWRWLEGMPPADTPFSHPFYWAAFTYSGH